MKEAARQIGILVAVPIREPRMCHHCCCPCMARPLHMQTWLCNGYLCMHLLNIGQMFNFTCAKREPRFLIAIDIAANQLHRLIWEVQSAGSGSGRLECLLMICDAISELKSGSYFALRILDWLRTHSKAACCSKVWIRNPWAYCARPSVFSSLANMR